MPIDTEKPTQGIDSGLPNLSDRPLTQDKTIDVFADVLYWHASETVYWAVALTASQNSAQIAFKSISFDWNPGFRVGFGYNMHHDQWDTQFSYTGFRQIPQLMSADLSRSRFWLPGLLN